MFFNFKNKNMLIILLLLVVLASVFCYSFMMKSVEGNTNLGTTVFSDNFTITKLDHVTNTEYYRINSNSRNNEISFVSDTPITALTPVIVPVSQVTGNINDYMYANSYDMYRKVSKTETPAATETNPTPTPVVTENYEFYKITVPYSLSVVSSTTTPVTDTTTPSADSTTTAADSTTTVADSTTTVADGTTTVADGTTTVAEPVAQSDETQEAELLEQAAATPETPIPMVILTTTFSMQGSGLSPATITNLQTIIGEQASIIDPDGATTVTIAPTQVTIIEVPQGGGRWRGGGGANSLLKIDISVPSANKDTILAQLTMFSSVDSFNTALTTGGILPKDLTIVNKMVDLAVKESFMNLEGFGNMGNFFSKFFGKKVKEGNTNLGTTTNNLGNVLIGIKNNDYTKVYSRSGNLLNITINVTDSNGQKTVLVQDGTLKVQPQSEVSTPPPTTTTTTDPNLNLTAATAISGGNSVNIGDINVPGGVPGGYYPQYPSYVKDASGNYVPTYNQVMNPYMLPGSDPILMNQYNTPFYGQYSSFESVMNNPSNPLVNPVNSMNPVEYSQTLFGPWTTPMMTKTACLNCYEDKEKINDSNGSNGSNSSNGSNGSNNSNGSNGSNSSNNIFNNLNSQANTMMAQNGEVDENEGSNVRMNRKSGNSNNNFSEYSSNNSNVNSSNNNQAPCPPCGRCPDTSNFECKKVPNYEMGLDNTSLPRPILSDFSTFGT